MICHAGTVAIFLFSNKLAKKEGGFGRRYSRLFDLLKGKATAAITNHDFYRSCSVIGEDGRAICYTRHMNILVTGGAGYIGSHTIIELMAHGHTVVIVDNLSNSRQESITRVQEITGQSIPFYEGDVCDKGVLRKIFDEHHIDAAIHFAGLKAVDKSVEDPLSYYRNNLDSSLSLCEVMQEKGVKKLIFSSSAAVYGKPAELPLKETSPAGGI